MLQLRRAQVAREGSSDSTFSSGVKLAMDRFRPRWLVLHHEPVNNQQLKKWYEKLGLVDTGYKGGDVQTIVVYSAIPSKINFTSELSAPT